MMIVENEIRFVHEKIIDNETELSELTDIDKQLTNEGNRH